MTGVRELFDLSGATAIVTGGGTGIGLQMADALAEAGANLVLCSRDGARCETAAAEIADRRSVGAYGQTCDVSNPQDVRSVVERAVGEYGTIDILINNAGTSWGAAAEVHPLEAWEKVIRVNLTGTFLFSQAVGRVMIDQRRGRIVNIASVLGIVGSDPAVMDAVAYSASKTGVIGFSRDLATKWARHGITVNVVAPGWFPTDISRVTLSRAEDTLRRQIPMGRFGGPDDLKGAVVFLSSSASSYVTGQTLVIDGGLTAW